MFHIHDIFTKTLNKRNAFTSQKNHGKYPKRSLLHNILM